MENLQISEESAFQFHELVLKESSLPRKSQKDGLLINMFLRGIAIPIFRDEHIPVPPNPNVVNNIVVALTKAFRNLPGSWILNPNYVPTLAESRIVAQDLLTMAFAAMKYVRNFSRKQTKEFRGLSSAKIYSVIDKLYLDTEEHQKRLLTPEYVKRLEPNRYFPSEKLKSYSSVFKTNDYSQVSNSLYQQHRPKKSKIDEGLVDFSPEGDPSAKLHYDLYSFMQYVLLPLSNRKLDLVDIEVYDEIDEILKNSEDGDYTRDPVLLQSKLEKVMQFVASSSGTVLTIDNFVSAFVGNFIYSELYDQTDFMCRFRIGDKNFCELDKRCGLCPHTGLCRTKNAKHSDSLIADRTSQELVHMYMRKRRNGEWTPVATVKLFAYPFLRLPTPPVLLNAPDLKEIVDGNTDSLNFEFDRSLFVDFTNLSTIDTAAQGASSYIEMAALHVNTTLTETLLNMTVTVLLNYATAKLTLELYRINGNNNEIVQLLSTTILPLIQQHMIHVGMGNVTVKNLSSTASKLKFASEQYIRESIYPKPQLEKISEKVDVLLQLTNQLTETMNRKIITPSSQSTSKKSRRSLSSIQSPIDQVNRALSGISLY